MAIHHTQVKLAHKMGVEIVATDDGFALTFEGNKVATGDDLKALLAAYGKHVEDEDGVFEAPEGVEFLDGDEPAEDADEAGDEPAEDDEEDGSRSIVKPKYKAIYAASALPGTCGDDYAAAFAAYVTDEETGELNVDALKAVAKANKIDVNTVKYGTAARGWQGRMRMVIGNILRGRVRKGFAVTIGSQVFEPVEEEGEAEAK